jgi:hypothetical protein
MNFNKIIIFSSLIISSYAIERRHHMGGSSCSSITCGRDCQRDCGWSSFWNRCMKGYTTTRSELNSGSGCTTIPSATSTITSHLIFIINYTIPSFIPILTTSSTISSPTSTISTSYTSTISTSYTSTISTSYTSTISTSFTSTATSSITSKLFNISQNELNSDSYTYISAILVPIFFIIVALLINKKRKQNRRQVVINDRREYINRMYKEHTVYDEVYEEPINSITPYSVSRNFDTYYEEPIVSEEDYEHVGHQYEYDDKIRAWENKKYEM